MAGMIEIPEKWYDVDLAHALPSDPRPWIALCSALAERCAAVHREIPDGILGVYEPSVAACGAIRAEIAYLCSSCFVTLDVPREAGLGWNYNVDKWSSFPRPVWPGRGSNKPTDADYPVFPPFPDSEHPMIVPAFLAPEGDGENSVYRAFLADCAFWLDQCRYVNANAYAVCEKVRGEGSWAASLAESYAGVVPSDNPVRKVRNISAEYSFDGTSSFWKMKEGPFELYAVNPSSLRAVALLVLAFQTTREEESFARSYETRKTIRNIPGETFSTTSGVVYAASSVETTREESRHGSVWVAETEKIYSAGGVVPLKNAQDEIIGADRTNAFASRRTVVRSWNEAGSRSYLVDDETKTYSGSSARTDPVDSASANYVLFDSFQYGEDAGVTETSVDVPAFGRALISDLTLGFVPKLDPATLAPSADSVSLSVKMTCSPCVVLDYHDAYKFKLDEES